MSTPISCVVAVDDRKGTPTNKLHHSGAIRAGQQLRRHATKGAPGPKEAFDAEAGNPAGEALRPGPPRNRPAGKGGTGGSTWDKFDGNSPN